jgi:NadR type nicotinamide-nucleotide adenylyltransferase
MEKRFTHIKRVVLTGPESTGKSVLTRQLARHTGELFLPEYARSYVASLSRNYDYDDILHIAEMQVKLESEIINQSKNWLFIDTDLIITKVWFLHVFGRFPTWLDEAIKKMPRYCHLLCYPDIEWEADSTRENPHLREFLFDWYQKELETYHIPYYIIKGSGNQRFENALKSLRIIE